MSDFLTVEIFATFAGIITFVTALTQALKYFIPAKIDPRIYSLILSAIGCVMNLVFITKTINPQSIILTILNIFVVAFAASGGYEYVVKPVVNKIGAKKTDTE